MTFAWFLPVGVHAPAHCLLRWVSSGTVRPGQSRLMRQASVVIRSPPIPILPVLVGCPRCVFSWPCYFSAAAQRYGPPGSSRPHTDSAFSSMGVARSQHCLAVPLQFSSANSLELVKEQWSSYKNQCLDYLSSAAAPTGEPPCSLGVGSTAGQQIHPTALACRARL